MPVGRKPLPLFELVSDRDANARREPAPVLIPPASAPSRGTGPDFQPLEPKPLATSPGLSPRPSPHPDAPKHMWPGLGGKPLVFSTNVIWVAAAVVISAIVLVWIAGNANGSRKSAQDFQRAFGQVSQQPVPQDPLNTPAETVKPPIAVAPAGVPEPKSAQANRVEKSAPAASLSAGKVLGVQGAIDDPRQSGWNYLLLGTLGREDTAAAMQFFSKNGVETFAAAAPAVDRRGLRGNTYALFQLFAAKGVPSSEFGARQAEREKLKQEVVRLGAIWKKDHKGSMSFSDAFWLKND